MIGYGSLATAMALQRNQRQQVEMERMARRQQDDIAFMAQYRNRPDVKFQRLFGSLIALVDGQPHIPRVKRKLP